MAGCLSGVCVLYSSSSSPSTYPTITACHIIAPSSHAPTITQATIRGGGLAHFHRKRNYQTAAGVPDLCGSGRNGQVLRDGMARSQVGCPTSLCAAPSLLPRHASLSARPRSSRQTGARALPAQRAAASLRAVTQRQQSGGGLRHLPPASVRASFVFVFASASSLHRSPGHRGGFVPSLKTYHSLPPSRLSIPPPSSLITHLPLSAYVSRSRAANSLTHVAYCWLGQSREMCPSSLHL